MALDDPNYNQLLEVLKMAHEQASEGKGKERHAHNDTFENQVLCMLTRWGCNYPTGQAAKKAIESNKLRLISKMAAIRENLGAINYLAGDTIVLLEEIEREKIGR